jgi:hypothetical protein
VKALGEEGFGTKLVEVQQLLKGEAGRIGPSRRSAQTPSR